MDHALTVGTRRRPNAFYARRSGYGGAYLLKSFLHLSSMDGSRLLMRIVKIMDNENTTGGRFIRTRCEEKNRYSKKEAVTVQRNAHKNGRELRVYQCEFCNFWHLTKYNERGEKMR